MSSGRTKLLVSRFRHMHAVMCAAFLFCSGGDESDYMALAAVVEEGGKGLELAHGDICCEVEASEVRALEICLEAASRMVAARGLLFEAVAYADKYYKGEQCGVEYVRLERRLKAA